MLGRDRRRGGTPPAKKRTNREQSKNIAGTVPVPNPNPKPNQFSGRWLGTGARHRPLGALLRWLWGWGARALAGGRQRSAGGGGHPGLSGLGDREQKGNKTGTKGEQKGSLGRFSFLADFCGFGAGGPLRWPSWHNLRTTTPLI
jgi:hypothetical protein